MIARAIRDLIVKLAPSLFGEDLDPAGDPLPDMLTRLFRVAHEGVSRGGLAELSGSTAALAIVDTAAGVLTCAHVGDSRLVVASADGGQIFFETTDHDIEGEEEQRITEAGGDVRDRTVSGVSSRRVFLPGLEYPGLAMARSIGDAQVHGYGVIPEPTVTVGVALPPGGVVVVGSDGVWDQVSPQEAVAHVATAASGDPEEAARSLVQEAQARWLQGGGDVDDASAVVVYLPSHEETQTR